MKCALQVKYKGIKEVPAGSFVNDKGETINYNSSYKLIFDQLVNNNIRETSLKISGDLAKNISPNFKPYDDIVINLDLTIYSSRNISIKVISVELKK